MALTNSEHVRVRITTLRGTITIAAVRQTEKIRMIASALVAARPIPRTTPESTIIEPWLHTRSTGQKDAQDRHHQRIGANDDSHGNQVGTRDLRPQFGPNSVDPG